MRKLAAAGLAVWLGTLLAAGQGTIATPAAPSPLETLAARETQRYVYQATGTLWPLCATASVPADAAVIVVGRRQQPLVAAALGEASAPPEDADAYAIDVRDEPAGRRIVIAGGDDVGTLYGAYDFARLLGVRFGLHGDIVPDRCQTPRELAPGCRRAAPLFSVRGIQPFHDFPEGPDWWNVDEYKAVLAQLPKLRMNFIGLHTYPEDRPNAEPTVWIGPPGDFDPNTGAVRHSYPASYHNTIRGGWNWGYAARKTSDYCFGAGRLFDRDAFGAEIMRGRCPQPDDPAGCNALFNDAGELLRDAFGFARSLGVRTCVGTETPLTVPRRVRARLIERDVDPNDPNAVRRLYRGVFERAAAAYPLDYYWLWTPEDWTWGSVGGDEVQAALRDLRLALDAYRAVAPPFKLATCGWVLGPQDDRAFFDQFLPRDVAVSCINRQVGHSPVEKAFARVSGRSQWAIPWLEDDHAMTTPQLWVGRMRRDAVDAQRYGCDGLIGIHWRTRILAPNVLALADAAWDQSGWSRTQRGSGALDGSVAVYGERPIAGTDDDAIYQSLRWGMTMYRIAVPKGAYDVRLHFHESHFAAPGRRVFGITLQGRRVIDRLDIIAEAGRDTALARTFEQVAASRGTIDIEFVPLQENPVISAIEVVGDDATVRINCGGPAVGAFEADRTGEFRFCPSDDFYVDWCRAMFGESLATPAAELFTRLDGHLPRPAGWIAGPGGIAPDVRSWEEARSDYDFVDEFAALRAQVRGERSMARFDYWLANFRYLRAVGRVCCTWRDFDAVMRRIETLDDQNAQRRVARAEALPSRRLLIADLADVHAHLYATATTTGALGALANWQQHNVPRVLAHHADRLAELLGGALPVDAQPPRDYAGPPRLIVLTPRTLLDAGEPLRLRALLLSESPPTSVTLRYRPAGAARFARVDFEHVARGVYQARLAPPDAGLLEYYVEATVDADKLADPPGGALAPHLTTIRPSGT